MSVWVLRLIIANIAIFIISTAVPRVMEAFTLVPALMFLRPWTPVTYMFLHAGVGHIFFNMLALFFFGPRLEMELGGKHFLFLYFISGIMGAVLSLIFLPMTPIIGASGAVFGVMLGFAFYWPREPIYVWGILPVESRWMVIAMTGLSLYGGFGGGGDGVAHFAHLGGFVGGFIYLKWLNHGSRRMQYQREDVVQAISKADIERWSKIDKDKLHIVNREEFERIFAKINSPGAGSLTSVEREFLNRFSQQ
jgi:membrane associated rhomboid family serine protease